MSAEVKSHLTELLTHALAKVAPQQPGSLISLERPKQAQHGDFSCPAAMQLARALKRNPRELALELVAALPPSEWLERAEVAGSGFINLRVRPAAKQHIVKTILAEGDRYGRADRAGGRPVMVEFVSANPTGPLHVGHGRQAALGDAIGALLESQGWRVTREFYYNDAARRSAIWDSRYRRGFEKNSAHGRNFLPTAITATTCAKSLKNSSRQATPTARIWKP